MKSRIHIIVQGFVQGVFFRASSCEVAQKLGIFGWVRNIDDDRVEIMVEGDEENLKKLIEWCHKGPRFAKVEDVKVKWLPFKGEFERFEMRY